MKAESIAFAVAGMLFGVIVGWIIGTQQGGRSSSRSQPAAQEAADAGAQPRQAPVLDQARVQALENIVKTDPKNVTARVQLGNAYFDAERYSDAIKWYEDALKVDPKNVDASTDLGVSYYYSSQFDRALQQFDYSLKLDPKHTKTLLNQGIVLAFGKRDLGGASAAWQKVIDVAPGSPEAQAAKRALDTIKSAHPAGTGPSPSGT
jgi:cytochrome c-type biogenesis protein CcmH/NrfG